MTERGAIVIPADTTGVAEVRMCWSQVRNALGAEQAVQLIDALVAAADDQQTGAVLLTADGPAFSAGGNLPSILALVADGPDAVRGTLYAAFQGVINTIRGLRVPVIAVLDGPAVGLGCDIALACSMRVVGPRGWMRYGWGQLGLIPAPGGLAMLRDLVGEQRVWQFICAERLDAAELERWGVAVAATDAMQRARQFAAGLAALPGESAVAAKVLLREHDFDAHLRQALNYQLEFLMSEAFRRRAADVLGTTTKGKGRARWPD